MQAASRQSYAAAQDRLDGFAGDAAPDELRTVADELSAVAELLTHQVRLRRALSDPARAGADRAGLLRGLISGRVGDRTQELLDTLVAGRWSAAAELLDGCEQLGVQALLASAERAGTLAEVEDELFRFGQVVAGDPALAAALGDRRVPAAQRATLSGALLSGSPAASGAEERGTAVKRPATEGKATGVTIRAVELALAGIGGRSLPAALTKLVESAAQRRNRSVAYVTVATPLTEAAEQRLGAALSARYRRDISVKTTVDPRVLGGARVQVGADLYDGTVARRLTQARQALGTG